MLTYVADRNRDVQDWEKQDQIEYLRDVAKNQDENTMLPGDERHS